MGFTALRIGIVGAGPSALYAAQAALATDIPVEVSIIERLPVPFGLLRYGVAPDHPNMRALVAKLEEVIGDPAVRFFGGVTVGQDVSVADLRACFDAVIFAYGASSHRSSGIQNEEARICIPSSEFARWYCGHPEANPAIFEIVRRARDVAVIGAGNVALDVSRILCRSPDELGTSEMPDRVREALGHVRTRRVSLLARRGPHEARFTTKELRELTELTDCDVSTQAADFSSVDPSTVEDRAALRNFELLRSWSGRPTTASGRHKRLEMRFNTKPLAIEEAGGRFGLRIARSLTEAKQENDFLPVDLVVTAVGYRGKALEGLPFAPERGVLVTGQHGRVIDPQGQIVEGCYATGWIRRGPSGVVGSNKACAGEVVAAMIEDLHGLPRRADGPTLEGILRADRVAWYDFTHWQHIDELEKEAGRSRGAVRTVIDDRDVLYQLTREVGQA